MLDAYMKIDGLKGEAADNRHPDSIETTTVKVGENSLSQVADRLGVNHDQLLSANPQIKDPRYLQVGQEVHLPPHPNPKNDAGFSDPPAAIHAKDLPKAPLGDPVAASLVKESLLVAKSARLHADNATIDSQMKEAQQKFDNAMDAASTQMALGVASGVAAAASGLPSSPGPTLGHKSNMQSPELSEASLEYLIGMGWRTQSRRVQPANCTAGERTCRTERLQARPANDRRKPVPIYRHRFGEQSEKRCKAEHRYNKTHQALSPRV
ncbi:MAG TPA: LysM domain-containing protein [Terriglobales bacterium]|nr:LysM domain-containing protein [Terriglobales bacterium]